MAVIMGSSVSIERAQEIMGRNCGFDVPLQNFGEFSANERAQFANIPFTEEVLRKRYYTHMLRAIPRISICEMVSTMRMVDPALCHHSTNAWFTDHDFANDRGEAHLALIGKERVYQSIEKTWDDQQKLLTSNEFVPSARDLIYSIFAHYFASGRSQWLFGGHYVRCADVCSDGQHVAVSFVYRYGITMIKFDDERPSHLVGLASAVKHGS